jgi:apolipoprotein N-acyltransferase
MTSKKKTPHRLLLFLGPVLSGFLAVLAFNQRDHAWLVWVSLVPLMISLSLCSPGRGFILSLVCGFIFFPGIFSWILEIPGYRLFHHAILGIYLSLYLGLFGLAFCFIADRCDGSVALIAAPFLWVFSEYARANLGFMALPWAFLAHTQHQSLAMIQISTFTGAYGVSFLIVLVNAAFSAAIVKFAGFSKPCGLVIPISTKGAVSLASVAAVLMALSFLYGRQVLSDTPEGLPFKISVVQGNIEQSKKWDRTHAETIMRTYVDLSREAAYNEPKLIAWPEASTPGYILKEIPHLNTLRSLVRATKTYYLIGSSEYPKLNEPPAVPLKVGNTALLFSPEGRLVGEYLKIWLVPFKEYVPYEDVMPWPEFIAPKNKRNFERQGREIVLFEIEGAKFGVAICWESLFPQLFRKFVKQGAQFMLNITNEAAFGYGKFPYQFLAINIFRAVENKVFLVRSANTGISCFIDPHGRISAKLERDGKDIFVEGYLTSQVILPQKKTFYTECGDVFAYTSLTVSFLILAVALLRKE